MAVMLRLRRMGSSKRPFYRLVASDSRFPRDGRFLEILGYYDPKTEPFKFEVKRENTLNWLRNGAQMSHTVENLLRREGIVQEFNLSKTEKKSSSKSEEKKEITTEEVKPLDKKVDKNVQE